MTRFTLASLFTGYKDACIGHVLTILHNSKSNSKIRYNFI